MACEESQRVAIELRNLGHEAYSCDIQDCSGGHPEFHIQCDVIPLLNGNVHVTTCDGVTHYISGRWDMIIAFPPCTYLTKTGNRWYDESRYGKDAEERKENRKKAIDFFMKFAKADCEKIAIENPIGYMSTCFRKPDQIIQPFQFGYPESKATCLWLKRLPLLRPTQIVEPDIVHHKSGRTDSRLHFETLHLPTEQRAKIRSKTFLGVARAMAEQWAGDNVKPVYEQIELF